MKYLYDKKHILSKVYGELWGLIFIREYVKNDLRLK